jgi:hypothetical protein
MFDKRSILRIVIRARDWAKKVHGKNAAVLGAAIDLAGVLDLTEQGALDVLRQTAGMLEQSFKDQGKSLPMNQKGRRLFDRLLIDVHCEIAGKSENPVMFPVVRGLFEEGDVIHPASNIRNLTHIQLAIPGAKALSSERG